MKIYRALKTNAITQKFGENLWSGYKAMGMLGHNGWDFSCWNGEPIYWDCDIKGQVLNTEIDKNGGLGVNVITEDKDGIFKHRFWHLQRFACQSGQVLNSGELLGYGNMTGTATGNHLHRDIKDMIEDQNGAYKQRYPKNGYFGCIEIAPYFVNIFIKNFVDSQRKQVSILITLIEAFKKWLEKGRK